jgi:hypothetical protein
VKSYQLSGENSVDNRATPNNLVSEQPEDQYDLELCTIGLLFQDEKKKLELNIQKWIRCSFSSINRHNERHNCGGTTAPGQAHACYASGYFICHHAARLEDAVAAFR